MKKINFIIWVSILLLATACNNDEEDISTHNDPSLKQNIVTFSPGMNNVSVLIFGKEEDNSFKYQKSIGSGWSADGKLTTELLRGYYKFLFVKSAGLSTHVSQLTGSKFEDFKFVAIPQTGKDGYVLPVDEIWLPQTVSMADTIYEVLEPITVKNTLKRAVSQINLHVKRGDKDNGDYVPLPFASGENIMQSIKDIVIDVSGVAKELTIHGTTGTANTLYTFDNGYTTDNLGFVSFKGPFVFPSSTNQDAEIEITVNIAGNNSSPATSKIINVDGPLRKNETIEITLWFTSTYKLIEITVDTTFMSTPKDGDMGIWE